jgi:hypothetical protein
VARNANLYDICDWPILGGDCRTEPGRNLRFVYRKLACHPILKYLILKGCRHPDIALTGISGYEEMMRKAMRATIDDWQDAQWIETTFCPLIQLLDNIAPPPLATTRKNRKGR